LVCEEKPTKPTSSLSGTRSRKLSAAERAASSRDGSTSVADIEPDSSVTSTTDAFSTGTCMVACGRALATARLAAAAASRAAGSTRRSRGWRIEANVAAAGKRTANRRRRRRASA
jgi:hypothetical protein